MLKVLLVDDNVRVVEGLKRHIPWSQTGCECVGTASNGEEALALARTLFPNVVITDVRMPIIDGLELCSVLQAEMPGIHLIVISAYDDFDYAKDAMLCGVENYILKPIDGKKINELAAMLANINVSAGQYAQNISTFTNSTLENELLESLKTANHEKLIATIESIILKDDTKSFKATVDVALSLIRLLHSFIERMGLPQDVIGKTLEDSIRQLQFMVSVEMAFSFIISEYCALCDYIINNKMINAQKMFERVKTYIDKSFTDPDLSTNVISKRFNISQSYLCHIYKSFTNSSINVYITELRIDRAQELLIGTKLSVVEISKQVGYLDPHYFAKVFKKIKGISPTEIRNLAAKL